MMHSSFGRLFIFLLCFYDKVSSQSSGISQSNEVVDCNVIHDHKTAINGTVNNPFYPEPYPPNRECRISFHGQDGQRILLLFSRFSLHHPLRENGNIFDCDGVDHLIIYDGNKLSDGGKEAKKMKRDDELVTLCGAYNYKLPPFMSSGEDMVMIFKSFVSDKDVSKSPKKGFVAEYAFITNYGITSGEQVGEDCHFLYNATYVREGQITSPNPGGNYPRRTICQYEFFGDEEERDRITLNFTLFEIEGSSPCSDENYSDYLQFFENYDSLEPTAVRCGPHAPKLVTSRGSYLKLIFKSNEKFHDRGFSANFVFSSANEAEYLVINGANAIYKTGYLWILAFVLYSSNAM